MHVADTPVPNITLQRRPALPVSNEDQPRTVLERLERLEAVHGPLAGDQLREIEANGHVAGDAQLGLEGVPPAGQALGLRDEEVVVDGVGREEHSLPGHAEGLVELDALASNREERGDLPEQRAGDHVHRRRLVEAGVRFVQCQATFRLDADTGRTSNWDDHSVNSHIFNAYKEKLPSFDQSVSALVEDLYDRGLDRRVLFIFCGEFGRTPRIRYQDTSGRPGRDHWPGAMSVLVSGGGMTTGQVIGSTTSKGAYAKDRKLEPNDLLATIYRFLGIDSSHAFIDPTGRPMPIIPFGQPISELL